MSVYVIGDTHLSFSVDKPMDIFKGWDDYAQRIESNWQRLVEEDDTVIINGDISWAMSLEEAEKDLEEAEEPAVEETEPSVEEAEEAAAEEIAE